MDSLNKLIEEAEDSTKEYLILLRDILNTGSCNDCKHKDCKCMPNYGDIARYNCPFYEGKVIK